MTSPFETVGCTGKQAFADRHLARRAAQRRHGRNIYRCETCGLWHVGSADPRLAHRRKQRKRAR